VVRSGPRYVLCLLALLGMTACEQRVEAQQPSGTLIGSTRDAGVRVALRLLTRDGSEPVLAATFTPEQIGFHLYSTDLPDGGIEGVGRPTRLQVGGGLTGVSPAVADRQVLWLHVAGIQSALPVYPDGAVTLRMTVHMDQGPAARAWVSYAACSSTACLPPVTRRLIELRLPGAA